ncbi:hypothetical protein CEAn_00501 [Coxiella endosymbiont of Amblyomma nuttalli]|nr:hypothetical protein CEAn_00501 [Coxiella endosymbiont of Amblyomma nuttalli]
MIICRYIPYKQEYSIIAQLKDVIWNYIMNLDVLLFVYIVLRFT